MSMSLREYLHVNRKWLRVEDFAKKLGVCTHTISRISNGNSMPSIRIAKAIEAATEGKVKCYEMMEYCWKCIHDSEHSLEAIKKEEN